jgi:zinc transport system substrate-binding protein
LIKVFNMYLRTLIFIFIAFLAACSTGEPDDRPVISVSILPQKYLAVKIAGDRYRINVMVPPGSSPETYEPTPGQMKDVANSLLYFSLGYIEFERTMLNSILSGNSNLIVVNTAQGMDMIAAETVLHGDHVHLYGVDPHIWLSVPGVRIQAGNMTEAMIATDPDNKYLYLENYEGFVEELDQLHARVSEKLSNASRRSFLIFHPALAYFARDYGLTQIGIEEEGKNPTAASMKSVIDVARSEGIKDVIIQMEFERENARAVARELGGTVIEIDPLSGEWFKTMEDIAEKISLILNR